MIFSWSRAISAVLLAGAATILIYKQFVHPATQPIGYESGFRLDPPSEFDSTEPPLYLEKRLSDPVTKEVHAATIGESPDGTLHAFWYGGSREGHKDVAIYASRFDQSAGAWLPSQAIMDRQQAQQELHRYIKKIGNPVVALHDGRIGLFFVTVSIGGWAGSAINVKWSDDGETWGRSHRLITSPFSNVSTLVKSNAIYFQQGQLGLPVYHEFIRKFGELIMLDADNRVIDKQRLSWGDEALQPVVLVKDEQSAQSFLRYAGKDPQLMLLTETGDAGKSWRKPEKTTLVNPNAAIAGHRVRSGPLADTIMMVYNNAVHARNRLSLAISKDDGVSWQTLHDFEFNPDAASRFSYPYLFQASTGRYHLVYTWNRAYIKHIEFNDAWLIEQSALHQDSDRGVGHD